MSPKDLRAKSRCKNLNKTTKNEAKCKTDFFFFILFSAVYLVLLFVVSSVVFGAAVLYLLHGSFFISRHTDGRGCFGLCSLPFASCTFIAVGQP